MRNDDNERNNRRNRTVQSKKHQNTWRKIKIKIPGNIRSDYHQSKMNEKRKKRVPQKNEKKTTSRNQTLQ